MIMILLVENGEERGRFPRILRTISKTSSRYWRRMDVLVFSLRFLELLVASARQKKEENAKYIY